MVLPFKSKVIGLSIVVRHIFASVLCTVTFSSKVIVSPAFALDSAESKVA